jgi:transcriptional regulator with XRE-family HTH domain
MKPCVPVEPIGCTLWRRIGERIRARRIQRGFTNEQLAEELGVDLRAFDAYEAGEEQAPARVLTQIAELLEVSVLWFFQDITFEEESAPTAASRPGGIYRVATPQDRMRFLAEAFRKLDHEGQQHLIAIVGALTQTSGKCTGD